MKRILFDLTALKAVGDSRFHGGGEYSLALLNALFEDSRFENIYFLFDAEPSAIDSRIASKIETSRIIRFSDIQVIPRLAREHSIDVFVSGMPYRYRRVNFGSLPCMFTIHGLRRIELPYDSRELRYIMRIKELLHFLFRRFLTSLFVRLKIEHTQQLLNVSSSLKVFVDSEHTKHALLLHYPELRAEDLMVSYAPLPAGVPADKTAEGHRAPFFLMVSTHRWGKNAFRAVQAFDKLFSSGRLADKRVVLLGMNKTLFKRFKVVNQDRFVIRPYVERDEYEAFLRDAYALVYPSLNEGFGYPPYEAMKYGTPVAMSAVCSLPEVYKNDVLFFNPYDSNEIAVRILELDAWNWKAQRGDAIKAEAERIRDEQERMTTDLVRMILG